MNDETIIEQNEVKNEPKDAPKNQPKNEETQTLKAENKPVQPQSLGISGNKLGVSTMGTVAASVASAAAGVGATFGGRVLANKWFPDEPEDGEEISLEGMEDGEEEEVVDEENMDVEDTGDTDNDINVNVNVSVHLSGHDMAIATGVDDSMSFSQAFAAARQEVGPGGIFEWHGQAYGTYYSNEWNSMSDAEHDQYWADVNHTISHMDDDPYEPLNTNNGYAGDPEPPIDTMAMNGNPDHNDDHEPSLAQGVHDTNNGGEDYLGGDAAALSPGGDGSALPPLEPEPLNLDEEDVIAEFDLDDDGVADVAYVDANGNEIIDVALDTTGDGTYDTLVVDPVEGDDGEVYVADVVEINGLEVNAEDPVVDFGDEQADFNMGDDIDPAFDDEIYDMDDMPDDDILASNPDVDNLASVQYDPEVTIDNNMDMGDFV